MTTRPVDAPEGTIHVDADGTMLRRTVGMWEVIEPLRRRAWDVAVLTREFVGRYVCVSTPGLDPVAGFADRFEHGTMYHDERACPIGPTTSIAHDPVGRAQLIVALVDEGRELGRGEVVAQLERRVTNLTAQIGYRRAGGASDEDLDRLHQLMLAIAAEADVAARRVPVVSLTNLGS